jgi:hypothetical protein
MTLDDLKHVLEVNISRPDLEELYPDWINNGLQQICQDFSFNCMRFLATVVMPAGSSSVALPGDFKELTPARSPVSVVSNTDASLAPVNMTRREDLIATRATVFVAGFARCLDAYISNNGETWTLNLLDATTTPISFSVSYFRILPNLEAGDQDNYLTRTYPELVKAKIKAIGFDEINDPLGASWEAKYILQLRRAKSDDIKRFLQGRVTQMGGD